MTNKNAQKGLVGYVLAIIALLVWSDASYADCFGENGAQILMTTGDFHLHGKPKSIQAWVKDGGIKGPRYSAAFDLSAKIQSVEEIPNPRCDFIYVDKNLSVIKINNKNDREFDGVTISASHFNLLGEPDIFVRKVMNDKGPYVSSDVTNLIMVRQQEGKVSYSDYAPVEDKPMLMSRIIVSYYADGFLKSIDSYAPGSTSKDMNIIYSVRYQVENGSVVQQDMVRGSTGVITHTMKFEELEFDACKNWTKRIVHKNSIELQILLHLVETREISYHTPCE